MPRDKAKPIERKQYQLLLTVTETESHTVWNIVPVPNGDDGEPECVAQGISVNPHNVAKQAGDAVRELITLTVDSIPLVGKSAQHTECGRIVGQPPSTHYKKTCPCTACRLWREGN